MKAGLTLQLFRLNMLLAFALLLTLLSAGSSSHGFACIDVFAHSPNYITLRMIPSQRDDDKYEDVHYMTEEEREHHRVLIHDGRLVWPDLTPVSAIGGLHTFVMDAKGQIYMANPRFPFKGKLHHSTFLAGGPIAAAGGMEVRDGLLIQADNGSGHYSPPPTLLYQLKMSLERNGADLTRARFTDHRNKPVMLAISPDDITVVRSMNMVRGLDPESLFEMPETQRSDFLAAAFQVEDRYVGNPWLHRAKVAELIWSTGLTFDTIESRILERSSPPIVVVIISKGAASNSPEATASHLLPWALRSLDFDFDSQRHGLKVLAKYSSHLSFQKIQEILMKPDLPFSERLDLYSSIRDRTENSADDLLERLVSSLAEASMNQDQVYSIEKALPDLRNLIVERKQLFDSNSTGPNANSKRMREALMRLTSNLNKLRLLSNRSDGYLNEIVTAL